MPSFPWLQAWWSPPVGGSIGVRESFRAMASSQWLKADETAPPPPPPPPAPPSLLTRLPTAASPETSLAKERGWCLAHAKEPQRAESFCLVDCWAATRRASAASLRVTPTLPNAGEPSSSSKMPGKRQRYRRAYSYTAALGVCICRSDPCSAVISRMQRRGGRRKPMLL